MELSGCRAVPIYYDMPEEELLTLLTNINGVLFTGGGLDLINETTGVQHQYYKTARVIFKYALAQKDDHNITFPLLGIC